MTWDESEHPRDEIGRFTFKNGGEEEGKEKQEEGKTKKENDNKPKKEKNKQNDFSNIEPFKLGVQYNDVRIESPKEILYGANSKTSKDISIKNERNMAQHVKNGNVPLMATTNNTTVAKTKLIV